jgi:putative inorganic carbon (HCO3(-)) transporter
MNIEKLTNLCDKGMTFSLCALVYFLPISIALVEIFTGISIFFFLLKRGVIFWRRLNQGKEKDPKNIALLFIDSYKPKENDLNIFVWLFIFSNFISVLMSTYPGESFKGFMGKTMENTFVFFAFIEVINSRKRLKIFLTVYLISATLTVVNGLYQFFVGKEFIHGQPLFDHRVASSLRSHNDFGAYLVLVAPFLVSLVLLRPPEVLKKTNRLIQGIFSSPISKIWLSTLLIASLICLVLTFSRGSWIGFILSLFIFVLRYPKLWSKVGLLLGIVFVVGFTLISFKTREDFQGFAKILNPTGRWAYWSEAINIIKDYPVFGCGLNTYSMIGREYKILWGGYPHNCFLQLTAETGLLGLGIFLSLLVTLFHKSFQALAKFRSMDLSQISIGALAGLLGFFIHSFWDTTMYSATLSVLMWIYFGIIISAQKIDVVS